MGTVPLVSELVEVAWVRAAVRKEVFEKRNNDQPILETDVPNISQVVGKGREGKKVASLAGLEKCRSIAAVELDLNDITDLTPLRELKNVQLPVSYTHLIQPL